MRKTSIASITLIKTKMLFLGVIVSFLVGCGGGDTAASDTPTVKDIAIEKIMAYAEDINNPAPTLQDYFDAGVTSGLSSENLAQLNAIVDQLELVDVDTTAEIVALTTQLNITIEPLGSPNAGEKAQWGFNWDDGSVWQ